MSKKFLSVGDTLINPDLLAYAVVDGQGPDGRALRLGFAAQGGGRNEIRLVGDQAGEVLRWLRLNADFLVRCSPFHPNSAEGRGRPTSHEPGRPERFLPTRERPSIDFERKPEPAGRF
jgi:hypothetical protein